MGKLVMLLGLIVLYIESHKMYFTIFKLFLFSLFLYGFVFCDKT